MENFKFDLTNEQVRLLHWILEDYFTRLSNRAIMLERLRKSNKNFDACLIHISTLCQEFDIQTDLYLCENGLTSFVDVSDDIKKF